MTFATRPSRSPMRRRELTLLLRVLLPLLTFTNCAHNVPKRTYPQPPTEELLSALSAHERAVTRLNLQTRTTSWLGGDRVAATVLMLVDRAGKLRFEAEVSLKGTVAALTTDGSTFQLLDLDRNEFHQGPACPRNVARLVRIPLQAHEIAAILLGDAPLGPGRRLVAADWDGEFGAERLEFEIPTREGGHRRVRALLRKHKTGWSIVGVEGFTGSGSGRRGWWRVRYEDHEAVAGVLMPNRIRFAEPGAGFDEGVDIRVRDRRMNPEIPEADFRLTPPPNMFVDVLECDEPR